MMTKIWCPAELQSSLELGFSWDGSFFEPNVARHTRHKVVSLFRRELPEHVYEALHRVFNPMTYTEVKTMCDGASVGGIELSDFEDALYLVKAHKFALAQLQKWDFEATKQSFKRLNEILAFDNQEAGRFMSERDEDQFDAGWKILEMLPPLDRAILFFAFAKVNKFLK